MSLKLAKIKSSSTLMTWLSFGSKTTNQIIILPLILIYLETDEISLWYLFLTFINLQNLADMGFSQTFSRIISYSMGGRNLNEIGLIKKLNNTSSRPPNLDLLRKIWGTMHKIYNWLSFFAFILLLVFGTLSLLEPIAKSNDQISAWSSWGIILFTSLFLLRGNKYSAYLQGVNEVALLRRWEAIFELFIFVSYLTIILLGGGLLGLVIINQSWKIVNIFRNRFLAKQVNNKFLHAKIHNKFHRDVFDTIWPSVWRSGLGIIFAQGPIHFSGIIYAQFGPIDKLASFLVALRILKVVNSFSQAPFYSQIPLFNLLRAQGKDDILEILFIRRMRFSYYSFIIPSILVGLFSEYVFNLIPSNVQFVQIQIWFLLSIGGYLERFGAMHLHIFSTTNQIIWHIANGVTAILFFSFTTLFLFYSLDILSFPLAMIISNLLFYCWYTASKSYTTLKSSFMSYESRTSFFPALILLFSFLIFEIIS